MRTLLHLSDLHFGRIDERLLAPLRQAVARIKPDLVVVSGDLTQRARSEQFRTAKSFLNSLPSPQIIVPGNHDVPMHNPIARFFYPLAGYRRHFSYDAEPYYQDEEIAVLGLNSSRSLTIQHGRLNDRQIERLVTVFRTVPASVTKILVCHHPFSLPPGDETNRVVGGAARVLAAMAACRADAVLSGHLHTTHVGCTALEEGESGWAVLLSQAGTATSTRLRGQEASFNVLRVRPKLIEFQPHVWNKERLCFVPDSTTNFNRVASGWVVINSGTKN
jgi:3',5'-cyclic AMP phosphodiesterase CpdA